MKRNGYTTFLAFFLIVSTLRADDIVSNPYLLRLASALTRSSNYANSLGMPANAAHDAGWSVNPAADDVHRRESPIVTSTVLGAFADSGAIFFAPAITVSFPFSNVGTMSFAHAYTDTPDPSTLQGLNNVLRSNEYFWSYSTALSPLASVGMEFRYTTARIKQQIPFSPVTFSPTTFDSDVEDLTIKLGGRWKLTDDWAIGLMGNLFWLSANTAVQNITTLPNPSPPPTFLPPGTVLARADSAVQSQGIRGGLAYTPLESFGLFADAEYLNLQGDSVGSLDLGRFYLGAELSPNEIAAYYGGITMDTSGEVTISTAVSLLVNENVNVAVGYQENAFPELSPEFGTFRFVGISGAAVY